MDGKPFEYVKSLVIYESWARGCRQLSDSEDIQYRLRCSVGQTNSVLCFGGLDAVVRTSLL